SARLLYEDKVRQTLLLEALGFNTPRTWVFFDREAAFEFLRSAEYPLVFKLRKGAAAKSVALLRDRREALRYVRLMFDKGLSPNAMPGAFGRERREKGL